MELPNGHTWDIVFSGVVSFQRLFCYHKGHAGGDKIPRLNIWGGGGGGGGGWGGGAYIQRYFFICKKRYFFI